MATVATFTPPESDAVASFVPPDGDAIASFTPPDSDRADAAPLPDRVDPANNPFVSRDFSSTFTGRSGAAATPQENRPTFPVIQGIGTASKNAMYQAAGRIARQVAGLSRLMPGPYPKEMRDADNALSDNGQQLITDHPVENPVAVPLQFAANLAPVVASGPAAPLVLGAQAAGEAKSDLKDRLHQQYPQMSDAEIDKLSTRVALGTGVASGLAGKAFEGIGGTGIVSRMLGGGTGGALSNAPSQILSNAVTGDKFSAGSFAKDTLLSAATTGAFAAVHRLLNGSAPQVPPELKGTLAKIQQIQDGVANGTIDDRAADAAIRSAVQGQTADTGIVVKAQGGAQVLNPAGGILLTPHDGAVVRSLIEGTPTPPLPGPEVPKPVGAKVSPFTPPAADIVESPTSFVPPPTDVVATSNAQPQEGGPNEATQEGRQEVLAPPVSPQEQPGAASTPVAAPTFQPPAADIIESPQAAPARGTPKTIALDGFSKAALENELLTHHQQMQSDSGEAIQFDRAMSSYQNPFTFSTGGDTFPGEIQHMMENNAALRSLFKKGPGGNGADALGDLGYDRYFQMASRAAGGQASDLRDATQTAKDSPDPRMQFYAAMYENLPKRANLASKPTLDPGELQYGTEFEMLGHKFQVVEDADGLKTLRDGGSFPELPADMLGAIPYDKGTLQQGAEPDVPDFFHADTSAMQTGIFGQPEITSSGVGEQQPMFHQPVEGPAAATPAGATADDAKIGAKFNPAATPSMFRQGAVNFGAPIESAKAFVQDDVVPSAKAVGDAFKSAGSDLQRTFAPQTRGPAARFAKGALREAKAELDRRDSIAEQAFAKSEKFFEHKPKQHNLDFYTAVETGQGITDQNLKPARDLLRGAFEDRYQQMKALGAEPGYIQDYLPHLYEDPAKAAAFASDFLSKRPFEGSKFFKKQRVFPTLQDGVNAGLKPRTLNPMSMARLALHQMDKYITVLRVKQELSTNSMRSFVKAGQKPLPGWKTTSDRADTVMGRSAAGETVIRGHYAYPEPVVNLIDNYLSPGLAGKQWYRGLMWLKNNMNLFNLGYSLFHVTFTTGNSFAAKIGTSLQYAANGDLKMAAVKLAEVPIAPMADIVRGSRLLSEWVKPGSAGHDYAMVADAYLAGGGRATRPAAYRETIIRNLGKAIEKGNIAGAALRLPAAGAQFISHLIMEKYVPRIKNGAAVDQLRMALDRHNGPVTRDTLRKMMAEIVDRQDDQFGELEYSNLFWNKTAHHLGQLAIRAQGWTLGSLRLGVTAAKDAATNPFTGSKTGSRLPLSVARVLGIGIFTAAMGAVIQKLLSGKDPESVKDLIYPRTGDKDRQGNDVRLKLPTYANEGVSWARHPLTTLAHKLSPLVSEMYDAIRNQDYYGNKITDPKAPVQQQVKDYAAFFAKQQKPFSVQSQDQLKQEGASVQTRVLSGLGIGRANAEIVRSPAMNLAYQLSADSRPAQGMTPQQAARSRTRAQISDTMARDPAAGAKLIQQALADKTIVPADIAGLVRRSSETALQYKVKGLPATDAMEVWNVADDTERSQLVAIVIQKIARARELQPSEKQSMLSTVQEWAKGRRKAG